LEKLESLFLVLCGPKVAFFRKVFDRLVELRGSPSKSIFDPFVIVFVLAPKFGPTLKRACTLHAAQADDEAKSRTKEQAGACSESRGPLGRSRDRRSGKLGSRQVSLAGRGGCGLEVWKHESSTGRDQHKE